jgi:oligoendopeptidase F
MCFNYNLLPMQLLLQAMFTAEIKKIERAFIPSDYNITDWASLQPFFDTLQNTEILSATHLQQWLKNVSELSAVISENYCWRQINMTCDTTNKAYDDAFNYWCTELQGPIAVASNALNEKFLACPFIVELDKAKYGIYIRNAQSAKELYREENVALQSEEALLAQQYGTIAGAMTIEVEGKEITLQQAAKYLQQEDRVLRKEVYEKVGARRLVDKDSLNELFDKLLALRQQIATNAGFDNYRDYKFKELGRFDYTVKDCENFHEAVRKHIVPLCKKIYAYQKKLLGLENLNPYDVDAVAIGTKPLIPFTDGQDLLIKSTAVFDEIGSFFGDCLRKMTNMQHMDLESRLGKAPGGYNCPLAETGVPFIFMNAASTADDMITMMHEGGHAIHSFVSHDLELSAFKEYPMEIAELASMSMELMSMDYWDKFFEDKTELQRAKALELNRVITILPWIAIIDKFQHWLYTNNGHSVQAREEAWLNILAEYDTDEIDYSEYGANRKNQWQKQLHLFEVPFYYIEYGIAQLGALAVWQNYKNDKNKTVDQYLKALSLGYTTDLKSLYKHAGIEFDFSDARVKELGNFVDKELAEVL